MVRSTTTRKGIMIPIAKPYLKEEEASAAKEAILSGWVSQGPKVKEFEEKFADCLGAKHACAVSSCTTALHLALLTAGVRPGQKVVTVSHSFIATANCIRICGAEPVFIDIDLDTYNISVEKLKEYLQKDAQNVAALLLVHQMGMPCDLTQIIPLAKEFNIPVIEDAACAIGSEISFDQGKTWEKIGKPHGDIACFSFHPRKVITTGEGGMLTTNSTQFDEKFRLLRHQGMNISDLTRHEAKEVIFEEYTQLGFNYRMTDIQAAIGIQQIKRVPELIQRRRDIASVYSKELSTVSWLKLIQESNFCRTNWQSFPVRVLDNAPVKRNELMQYLLDNGVATRPGIMNAHQEKEYTSLKYDLHNSETAKNNVLLLPIYFQMNEEEIKKVIELIKNV